jgi:hypothetical protein
MDEISVLAGLHAHVSGPDPVVTADARRRLFATLEESVAQGRRRRRPIVLLAALAVAVFAAVGAVAAVDILNGPAAPAANDAALQHLFPPLGIGHASILAANGDRTLFGARTAAGGYCFSAKSPTDTRAEGGHCVSDAEVTRLDAGEMVGFAISGGTVGGYAPNAARVRIHGLGFDETVPVAGNGWWVGDASPVYALKTPSGTLIATTLDGDGHELASDPILRVTHLPNEPGVVAFAAV